MKHPSINYFLVKTPPLYGNHYGRIKKQALATLKVIESKTKRRPYIRSKYFAKQKIFTNLFLSHLFDKNTVDRKRRLRFLPCAIELIEKSTYYPEINQNQNKKEQLYRFYGRTKDKQKFAIQIKETSRKNKYFMSVFPI